MQKLIDFATQYWSEIVYFLTSLLSYFFIMLYKHSTKNLNLSLKTTFTENSAAYAEAAKLYEQRMEYAVKQARKEYADAIELCKKYEARVEKLERVLEDFLGGEE
jgi:hypothetical protein